MPAPLQLLVIDAYDNPGRAALKSVGATWAGELYARALEALEPAAEIDVLEMQGPTTRLPHGNMLTDYHGIVWTGSNLTIHKPNEIVDHQLQLSRAAFDAGVPQFGSCWAAHLATVAAGGVCATNPKGREFGIARQITLTETGATHPLVRGRPKTFEGFISHEDMIVELPPNAEHLAGNEFTEVQAIAVRHANGQFWAVQYHPEYNLHEVARLAELRRDQLIAQGRFADKADVEAFIDDFESLHGDPTRDEIIQRQRVAADLIDPVSRRLEIRNWLDELVRRQQIK